MLARKLVFPNPKNLPTLRSQRPRHKTIPLFVRRQFALPERTIVLRLRRVPGAAMPETTVHENRDVEFRKNKIPLAQFSA